MSDYQDQLLGNNYRLVLRSSVGEFYSELKPYAGRGAVKADIQALGALSRYLHRAEVQTAAGWELV